MKTKILFLFNIAVVTSFAQSPNWQWAKSAGGNYVDQANSIITDTTGNVYTVGYFASLTCVFDTITLTNTAINGTADMFLVKYNAAGNVLWAKSAGGINYDAASAVTTDAWGNVFVAGTFRSPIIVFGNDTLTNTDNSGNSGDIFLVKYNAGGAVLWAKSPIGNSNYSDGASSVTTDVSRNVILAGGFASPTLTIGTTTLNNFSNNTGTDMFLIKYDSAGKALWAKSAGGIYSESVSSVTIDTSGNIFVAGGFQSPMFTFGTYTLTNTDAVGGEDMFLVKYDSAGNVRWAKSAGGIHNDFAQSVTTNASGNVLVSGVFASTTIIFELDTLINVTPNIYDVFLAKYDTAGNLIRASSIGGSAEEDAPSATMDPAGNLLVVGYFYSPVLVFDSNTLTNVDNTNNTTDIFIAKYDGAGNIMWAKSIGGNFDDYASSATIDVFGNAFIAGLFKSLSLGIGSTTLNNIGSGGSSDMFIAKLGTLITGTTNFKNETGIYIYPNPFNTTTIIKLNAEMQNSYLTIYNIFGQTIKSIKVIGNKIKIDKDDLPSGVYFIQLIKDNETVTSNKLIITD